MEITGPPLPHNTVDALARGWYNEAQLYGFQRSDLVRFVNTVLQLSIDGAEIKTPAADDFHALPISEPLPIQTESFSIRAATPADNETLEVWLQEPEGSAFLRSRLTTQRLSLEQLLASPNHHLGIITLPDGRPIGCLAFLDVDVEQRKAELRKLIGPASMRGKGYAKQATKAWLQYGINAMGLQKIYLNCLCRNIRNIRINQELGFSVEGILRNEIFVDGRYEDVMRMALYKID